MLDILKFITAIVLIFLPNWFGKYEGRRDAKRIAENGSADSLKEAFHLNNAVMRGAVLLLFSLTYFAVTDVYETIGYVIFATAMFGNSFTVTLNSQRGLHPFYVSRDAWAAKFDKTIAAVSNRLNKTPETVSKWLHISALWIGVGLFLAGVIASHLVK